MNAAVKLIIDRFDHHACTRALNVLCGWPADVIVSGLLTRLAGFNFFAYFAYYLGLSNRTRVGVTEPPSVSLRVWRWSNGLCHEPAAETRNAMPKVNGVCSTDQRAFSTNARFCFALWCRRRQAVISRLPQLQLRTTPGSPGNFSTVRSTYSSCWLAAEDDYIWLPWTSSREQIAEVVFLSEYYYSVWLIIQQPRCIVRVNYPR